MQFPNSTLNYRKNGTKNGTNFEGIKPNGTKNGTKIASFRCFSLHLLSLNCTKSI